MYYISGSYHIHMGMATLWGCHQVGDLGRVDVCRVTPNQLAVSKGHKAVVVLPTANAHPQSWG